MSSQYGNSENKVSRIENYLKSKYTLRYNTVLQETEILEKGSSTYKSIDDRLMADIRIDLSEKGYTSFKGLLDDLIKSKRFAPDYNPFVSYFENLPAWNGNDYIGELTDHIGIKDSNKREWFKRMFKKHLIRTVACSLRLLSFNKHCFVLLGKQNDGKSSLIRYLIPNQLKEYYKENPPLDHKDSIIALSQNLLINLDELHDLNKTDANKVKSLFSQADTKVRVHYAVKDTLQARYASFFGTINEREFLNDVTGNVRWLIFEIDGIQHDHGGKDGYSSRVNIDHVWAQAYALVMAGDKGELTSDEVKTVEQENLLYQRTTPEIDLVSRYLIRSEKGMPDTYAVTATEIIQALQAVTKNAVKLTNGQLGKAMTFLKHEKQNVRLQNYNYPVSRYFVTSRNPEILNFFQQQLDYLSTK